MRMSWHDLLFAHWPVPVATMRALVPASLDVDTFDGVAWIGVVPFRMTRVGPLWLPPLPVLSSFPELNVRTYVTRDERPGVWFFSLDAASRLAVRAARRLFHLPYFDAAMSCAADPNEPAGIAYRSTRTHRDAPAAEFVARYRPTGDVFRSRPGDLDAWLTERYCLYAADPSGRVRRVDVEHAPWPLQPADAEIERNTMAAPIGITLAPRPAHLHFARRLDVRSGGAVRLG